MIEAYHPSVTRSGSSRWSIVHRPSRSSGRVAALAILAILTSGAAVVPVEAAIARDPHGLLRQPINDVAIVRRSPDDPTPDLMTIDLAPTGEITVRLLSRDDVWSIADKAMISTPTTDDEGVPWLVAIGDSRFVIVLSSEAEERTRLIDISVERSDGTPRIAIGPTLAIEQMVTGAGVADVDGDGSAELILAGDAWVSFQPCSPTAIAVVAIADGLTLIRQQEIGFPGSMNLAKVAAAAFGEWDGRPGTDLLAYASIAGVCMQLETSHIVGIRLSDLGTIVDVSASLSDPGESWSGSPLMVDVDGDGRDEAVVTSQASAAVVDLVEDWQRVEFGARGSVPIDVTHDPEAGAATLVRWVQPTDGTLRTGRITRLDEGLQVDEIDTRSFTDDRTVAEDLAVRWSAYGSGGLPPVTLRADLDADGCSDLIGPRFLAFCGGVTAVRTGPAFIASRPLAVVGGIADRRLLLEEGLSWRPQCCGIELAPAASDPIGTWTSQPPTPRFRLAEVPLEMVREGSMAAPSVPIIGTEVSLDDRIDLTAPTGSRVLVRSLASDAGATAPRFGSATDPISFLESPLLEPFEVTDLVTIPVPGGSAPGEAVGTVQFRVDDPCQAGCPDVATTDHWAISAAILDELGDISPVTSVVAVQDVIPPDVTVDTPFLSPSWPFDATLTGHSEPGATVRIGDGPSVLVDAAGVFRVPTRLAPWPQTVEVTAIDASGNSAAATASMMGGVDVRQLPWLAIATFAVFAAAFVSAALGRRRPRPLGGAMGQGEVDLEPLIEELDTAPARRRD